MILSLLNRVLGYFNPKKDSPDANQESLNLQKNFTRKEDGPNKVDNFIDRKTQSMKASQGASNFSGSAYNGPGNVNHEKRDSNMGQRNF